MIKNTNLFGHKGIQKVRLLELGRLNVLCGKNSSGKSSVVEAINNKEKHSYGIMLDLERASALLNKLLECSAKWQSPHPRFLQSFAQEYIPSLIGRYIFSNELNEAVENYRAAFRAFPQLSRAGVVMDDIFLDVLKGFFVDQHATKTVLLPAKRELRVSYPLPNWNSGERGPAVEIIKRLFELQSQNESTEGKLLYKKINDVFSQITNGYSFNIQVEANQVWLQFKTKEGLWLRAEDVGLGLRDILYILHHVLDSDSELILIEEPENHIHPEIQRKLLSFLKTVKDKQFIFTSHSNVFVDLTYVDRVYLTEINHGQVAVSDETSKSMQLSSMGYSIVDNLVSDLIVLVEGKTDVQVFNIFLEKMGILSKRNIKFWKLFGDMMEHFDVQLFAEKYNVIALIDADPESLEIRTAFEEKCRASNVECKKLQRYSIENYMSLPAMKSVVPGKFDHVNELMPDKSVEAQLGISIKRNLEKIAQKTELADIEGTDFYDFLKSIDKKSAEKKGTAYQGDR